MRQTGLAGLQPVRDRGRRDRDRHRTGPAGSTFQTGWGTRTSNLAKNGRSWTPSTYTYGAGGGDSALFPNARATRTVWCPRREGGGRAVPDVALDADPTTGMLVGETQLFGSQARYGEYRIGGTSLASPLMGGMVALVGQRTGRLGFLNPAIYASVRAGKGQFTDVRAVHVGDGNVRPDYTDPVDGYRSDHLLGPHLRSGRQPEPRQRLGRDDRASARRTPGSSPASAAEFAAFRSGYRAPDRPLFRFSAFFVTLCEG